MYFKCVKRIALFFLLLVKSIVFAQLQNLVPDSSFEFNKFIPIEYSSIGASNSWNSPTRGTTDLFCKCDKKKAKLSSVNVPANAMGIQEAHSGKCYAGIFCVSHGYYREYLQTSLLYPLEAGKEYVINMHVSLSDYSPLAIDRLGVCLLNAPVKYDHSEVIRNLAPLYINLEDEVGIDVNDWHKISLLYKAKGGENTLLIGSFAIKRLWMTDNFPPQNVSTPIYKKMPRDAYYYFDDISVYEYKREVEDTTVYENPYFRFMLEDEPVLSYITTDTVQRYSTGMVSAFKNLLFKTGEFIIKESSFSELNILAVQLKSDPKLYIEIYGHTDNVGDEKKNIELSNGRAKAVADYLIAKGVNPGNVFYKGYGSSMPIETNNTEEGRAQNRRVEFLIKK